MCINLSPWIFTQVVSSMFWEAFKLFNVGWPRESSPGSRNNFHYSIWLLGWLLVATVRVLEKDQTIIFLQVLQQYAASILRYNQEILASFLLKHKSAGCWKIIPNIHQCKYHKVWQSLNNNFIILSC